MAGPNPWTTAPNLPIPNDIVTRGAPSFKTLYPGAENYTTPLRSPQEPFSLPELAPTTIVKSLLQGAWDAVDFPASAVRGEVDPMSDEGIARAADLAGMLTLGAGAIPKAAGEIGMGIRAFHGSPHDFDRFSMDKIGTGEGAQAYGHGLYFAEEKAVADGYRKALTRTSGDAARDWAARHPDIDAEVRRQLNAFADEQGMARPDDNFVALVMSNAAEGNAPPMLAQETVQAIKDTWKKPAGRMYEVDINASPDEFLDWDKPLSEQPEVMARLSKSKRKAVQNLLAQERFADLSKSRELYGQDLGPLTGQDLIKALSLDLEGRTVGAKSGEALRAAGIKGIRYKDAGSRGADAEGGTSNFVVFDDTIIDILKKYGIAGLTAGGAGAAAISHPDESVRDTLNRDMKGGS